MDASQMVERLCSLTRQEQSEWMRRFGAALTIEARSAYDVGVDTADGLQLRGFNEIQHRVYGRTRVLLDGDEWTEESLVGMLREISTHFGIAAEVHYAAKHAFSS